ncbi:MAG TPA: response regulator [Pseudolabrys sp.]|nr:response regulator [Pseudolabrys sp.]
MTAADTSHRAVIRILVVEDEPLVAIMLEEALQDSGYQVVGPVENLKSAIHLAGCEQIDAAVVDINIDGTVSGPVADRLIARGIPFIFVSGQDRELGSRYGDVPLLRKPFSMEDLHRAVATVLERNTP